MHTRNSFLVIGFIEIILFCIQNLYEYDRIWYTISNAFLIVSHMTETDLHR